MKFSIEKISELSGKKASIYTIRIDEEEETLFDRFLSENEEKYEDEVIEIYDRLEAIGEIGIREDFFKKNEGEWGAGDGIEALYDKEESNLRLYCIRYSHLTLILGGGGYKSKNIRALQEDPKLKAENYLLRKISGILTEAIKERDLKWDGNDFTGKTIFYDNDDEEYE